jgi:hypothetical protein
MFATRCVGFGDCRGSPFAHRLSDTQRFGTAIGASLLNPMSQANVLRSFGFGTGVWVIVTTVIAIFTGSYFAGRCAPVLGSGCTVCSRGR